jgi:hypothetical protein
MEVTIMEIKACILCNKEIGCQNCVMGIKMFDLVVPKNPEEKWEIGRVIGMSRFDLEIGPLLDIKNIISGEKIIQFPMHVDKMERIALVNPVKKRR